MQTVLITTNVASSNLAHGELYLMPHYVIKFASDLPQIDGFLWVFLVPLPIKLTAMITEILLKVALNAITLLAYINSNLLIFQNYRKYIDDVLSINNPLFAN